MRRAAFAAMCAACALAVGIPGLLPLASAADSKAGPPVIRQVTDVALPVDAETLERQYVALSSMPSVNVVYSALGPVRLVEGPTGVVLSSGVRNFKEGDEAREVLQKFKDVLLATGGETLKVRVNRMTASRRTIRMDQSIGGIPVLYGGVSVGIDDPTGLVTTLSATFLPDRGLPRQPKISAADAAKRVEQLLVERGMAKPGSVETSTPSLAYTGTHPDSTRGHLIWAVPARYTPADAGAPNGMFWIDAVDGEYVGRDAVSRRLSVYTGRPANSRFRRPGEHSQPFCSGLGPDKAWNIFFKTFDDPSLGQFPKLPEVKTAAVATANLLYGPVDADAVDRAFLAVGVGNNCSVPPPAPQMEAVDRCPRWLLRWPVVPGATVYHAQATPQAWGWPNATTIIDGNANQCTQRVTVWTDARVKACNGCGCSNWSNVVTMFPGPQCP